MGERQQKRWFSTAAHRAKGHRKKSLFLQHISSVSKLGKILHVKVLTPFLYFYKSILLLLSANLLFSSRGLLYRRSLIKCIKLAVELAALPCCWCSHQGPLGVFNKEASYFPTHFACYLFLLAR